MILKLAPLLIFMVIGINSKPVSRSTNESINKVDGSTPKEWKNSVENQGGQIPDLSTEKTALTEKAEQRNEETYTTTKNPDDTVTTKLGPLSWLLSPLSQKVQFSPQSFLQDRIIQLKEALNSLGLNVRQEPGSKQFPGTNALLHVVGVNDPGFYTNRLEPAGFLGGNGWLANKGGILGAPGAILSTGSLLTDYPTPYRKK